jgi:hypothetical protein
MSNEPRRTFGKRGAAPPPGVTRATAETGGRSVWDWILPVGYILIAPILGLAALAVLAIFWAGMLSPGGKSNCAQTTPGAPQQTSCGATGGGAYRGGGTGGAGGAHSSSASFGGFGASGAAHGGGGGGE